MSQYPATLTEDGDTLLVTFKDVPEAITFGKTEKEALDKAADALQVGLSFYINAGKDLPKPSHPSQGETMITCSKQSPSQSRPRQNLG